MSEHLSPTSMHFGCVGLVERNADGLALGTALGLRVATGILQLQASSGKAGMKAVLTRQRFSSHVQSVASQSQFTTHSPPLSLHPESTHWRGISQAHSSSGILVANSGLAVQSSGRHLLKASSHSQTHRPPSASQSLAPAASSSRHY